MGGVCGSCWAFSTTGSLEGRQQIANGTLISFSEQQLVDCAYGGSYGSYGCNGGSMYGAMTYYETYDAETEDTYPYISGSSTSRKSCQYSTSMDTDTAVTRPNAVTSNSVSQLKAAVSEGPVSVAIEADTYYFQTYSTGVMDNASSCGTNLDHGVLVVGYGTDPPPARSTGSSRTPGTPCGVTRATSSSPFRMALACAVSRCSLSTLAPPRSPPTEHRASFSALVKIERSLSFDQILLLRILEKTLVSLTN